MRIDVNHLFVSYGGTAVLNDVSLSIEEHEIVSILGPNGCGKSTLLRTVSGRIRPKQGSILFSGRPANTVSGTERAKRLAMLSQFHPDASDVSVEELVLRGRFPLRNSWGFLTAHDRERAENVLRMTGIAHLRKRKLGLLSGGERQKAWIAMTLAREPEVLLLDEPTTFLDPHAQFECMELIRNLRESLGFSVCLVLHDLNLASRFSDRVILMADGKIHSAGTPHDVLVPERLREVFSIESERMTSADGTVCCIPSGSAK